MEQQRGGFKVIYPSIGDLVGEVSLPDVCVPSSVNQIKRLNLLLIFSIPKLDGRRMHEQCGVLQSR